MALLQLVRAGSLSLLMVVAAVAGCDPDGPRPLPPLAGTGLDAPAGDLSWPVWLPDGSIYVVRQDADPGREPEVWRTRPGGRAERVDLPPERGCRITRYDALHKLPDGRLGVGQLCLTEDPAKDWFAVVAYNPADGSVQRLAMLGRVPASTVTWTAGVTAGYAAVTSAICAGLGPLTRDGVGRFPGPLTIDGRTWRVEEEFFVEGDEDCAARGRADLPAALPDNRLAFFASPESQGRSGRSRLDVRWQLYVWQPPNGTPQRVAEGFQSPLAMEATPDGRYAIAAARHAGQPGLWRVDLGSGDVQRLVQGSVLGLSLAPDARRVVIAVRPDDEDIDHVELRLVDLELPR